MNQKLEKAKSEMEKKILEKQVKEAEREIEEIKWEDYILGEVDTISSRDSPPKRHL